ncbi:hypothetical protein UFOVP469_31 [uncultured Caudovirales phage]|uniref:Uncharacterized protein n=1 Tax=uncultured Caudovirales phage TaxID=2100421 RepID=A0A6J5MF58_9CAUD|nr:hypothetical protein UFOVP469_31 [uncultured Caudovirales phage]CAB4189564.1 hypothetical protein UFOVP1200_4 [uncultured Caudovirales phage]
MAFSLASGRSLGIGASASAAIDLALTLYPGVGADWCEMLEYADGARAGRAYALRLDLPTCRVDSGTVTVWRGERGALALGLPAKKCPGGLVQPGQV